MILKKSLRFFIDRKILSGDGNSSALIDSLQKISSSPDNIKVSLADREGIVKFFCKASKKGSNKICYFLFLFAKVRREIKRCKMEKPNPKGLSKGVPSVRRVMRLVDNKKAEEKSSAFCALCYFIELLVVEAYSGRVSRM